MDNHFFISTNKNPVSYKCNEKIIFTVSALNKSDAVPCDRVKWTIVTDDGQHLEGVGASPLKAEVTLSRPGFAMITVCALKENGETDESFDQVPGGAGAEVEKISYTGKIPDDFDEFWGETERRVADFTPAALLKERITCGVPEGFDCYDVKISTFTDTPASGYVTIPKGKAGLPIKMKFRGYAIDGADMYFDENAVCASINAHGIENGFPRAAFEKKYAHLSGYGFSEAENASPHTSYWKNMMIRNLCAAKWLKSLPEWDKNIFEAIGGSQGALQAVTLAAHDKAVNLLNIIVPWLCDLSSEKYGYIRGWRPNTAPGLEYFDTVAQATRVSCPVKIQCHLGDNVCPPKTVTALYNAFCGEKQILYRQNASHGYHPFETDDYYLEANTPGITPGKYRHYKGNEYEVLASGFDSEAQKPVVVYRALYGEKNIWVRPAYMWNQLVIHNNTVVRRFTKI